jgi:hypothetical protein
MKMGNQVIPGIRIKSVTDERPRRIFGPLQQGKEL